MASAVAYAYSGRDSTGKLVKGKLEATSEGAAASRLHTMGISPIEVSIAPTGTGLNREINIGGFGGGVSLKDLSIMSRQMATMIGSGLSLLRTLNILAEQTENKTLARVLGQVRDGVETGASISDAFGKHEDVFPPIMINMVRAGETGGFLDRALESIAQNFEKEVKLRSTIKSAMTYPVIVLLMSLGAVMIMLIFIVPIFKEMFEGFGKDLPLPTQILVSLSEAMIWFVPLLLVVGTIFAVWWSKNKNSEAVRKFRDPIMLKLPVFGKLLQKIAIARFARNFSNMLGAGVPILHALKIVGETSGNWVIEDALNEVAESVRQGQSISTPLLSQPVFPPMVTQMIAVGEDAGSLEIMLDKIADFYDQEVEAATEQLTAAIEPLMIAFLGIVIGGMVIALYMPIFGIAGAVSG